jgi:hypothetical protein
MKKLEEKYILILVKKSGDTRPVKKNIMKVGRPIVITITAICFKDYIKITNF